MEAHTYEDAARRRLDQLIQMAPGESYSSVSALIGKNHAYIQQYIRCGRPRRLKERDRRRIAAHFGIPESDLWGSDLSDNTPPGLADSPDGMIFIPRFDTHFGTDPEALSDRNLAQEFVPFRQSFLRRLTRSSPGKLVLISVAGDSMYPTLADGDEILLDQGETTPHRDAIYAIRMDRTLQVKRISVNPVTGHLSIRSDNPLYESWSDCDPANVDILGRVIWVGRRL